MEIQTDRKLLRHALATLAYRGGKALRDVPDGFPSFRAGPSTRTPVEILGHLADLMEWGLSIAAGQERWSETPSDEWGGQMTRFYAALAAFDAFLESDRVFAAPPSRLFQGPVADAFTHVGQIAMLRRLAGGSVRGENYFKADISAGRVGPDQTPPEYEFD